MKVLHYLVSFVFIFVFVLLLNINKQAIASQWSELGTSNHPVVLSFLPNKSDKSKNIEERYYQGLVKAITARYGINIVVKQSKSYEAAVDDFCTGKTHIAVLGVVTYNEAKQRCKVAELLAVEVRNSESIYFSGFFVHKKYDINDIQQLKNQTLALGNPYSTSSFNYPLAMLINAGLQPEYDFKNIVITGSHAEAIEKLANGEVFAAASSFQSWRQAIIKGVIDPIHFKPLIKSAPLPNPPLVINKTLPIELKEKIRKAFKLVHTWGDAEKILNVARKIDRYDVIVDDQLYINTFHQLSKFDNTIKQRIVKKYQQ